MSPLLPVAARCRPLLPPLPRVYTPELRPHPPPFPERSGNVVSSNAVAKGASLKLDECLKEFYTREAAHGGFGRRALIRALDEIGLEVSEHQVDACLAGLLRASPSGTISYQLFSQLIRQALRSVGSPLIAS